MLPGGWRGGIVNGAVEAVRAISLGLQSPQTPPGLANGAALEAVLVLVDGRINELYATVQAHSTEFVNVHAGLAVAVSAVSELQSSPTLTQTIAQP